MIAGLWRTMRPKQWTKNGFIFIPLVFDAKLFQPRPLALTLAGFVLLCLISSVVYIVNDLSDFEKDRQHPTKRNRPLPSGQLSVRAAQIAALVLSVVTLALSFGLNVWFGLIVAGYFFIQLAYSACLKNVVIVDVMAIAAGFVLRVAAGAPLVNVERFSPWLYVFTTMLALFLALGKRRAEIVLLQDDASNHRPILTEYNLEYLDQMINVVVGGSIIIYSLYTFTAVNLPANHTMMLTIPFAIYTLFRLLYLIHVKGEGGAPDEILLRDRPLQIALVLWGIASALVLYH
ncbi:MAG: decaprenyl-phosphate phosphoribosyltransferase [Thermoflexales bacterium]|nr:decaprenyl-phosphate phosphoribosyltransferase [Thermoflexales bacterium]